MNHPKTIPPDETELARLVRARVERNNRIAEKWDAFYAPHRAAAQRALEEQLNNDEESKHE